MGQGESVDLLGLLRKRAADVDLDFLREAVAVLAEALMEAEVSAQIGAGIPERADALVPGTSSHARNICFLAAAFSGVRASSPSGSSARASRAAC